MQMDHTHYFARQRDKSAKCLNNSTTRVSILWTNLVASNLNYLHEPESPDWSMFAQLSEIPEFAMNRTANCIPFARKKLTGRKNQFHIFAPIFLISILILLYLQRLCLPPDIVPLRICLLILQIFKMKPSVFSCYIDVLLPARMASNIFYNFFMYSTVFL